MALVYRGWDPLTNTESYWDTANTHVQQIKEQIKEQKMSNMEDFKVYTPAAGLGQSRIGGAVLGYTKPPVQTLAQRINDKINQLQGQVEELQLVRSKLQAGKLDSITMDDLSKIFDY